MNKSSQQVKEEILKTLDSNENAGYMLRDITSLEWELDLLLTRFFTAQERFDEFQNVIISEFTFNKKIEILKKLKLSKKLASQTNAVKSLEKFRQLRNRIAHKSFFTEEDVDSIYTDNELRYLLSDFPKNFRKLSGLTKLRLNHLYLHYLADRKKH